jgi:two-component system nitrate/nitrite response regulator NarL
MSLEKPRCRVAIVDDHLLLAEGVEKLFLNDSRFQWVGIGHNVEDARRLLEGEAVDVLIIDLNLRGGDGFELVRRLGPDFPQVKFLVLTMTRNAETFMRLLEMGVSGCVTKDESAAELLEGVWRVCTQGQYLTQSIQELLLHHRVGRGKQTMELSARENQILLLVGRGLKNQEIAQSLGVSIKTVETHKENLKKKLGVANTGELARLAAQREFQASR